MASRTSVPPVPAPELLPSREPPTHVVVPRRAADEEEGSGVNVAAFLHALRRRWGLALALSLLCMGLAGGGAWLAIPEKHTAQTLLRVEASQPKLLFGSVEGLNN